MFIVPISVEYALLSIGSKNANELTVFVNRHNTRSEDFRLQSWRLLTKIGALKNREIILLSASIRHKHDGQNNADANHIRPHHITPPFFYFFTLNTTGIESGFVGK
jgi:hypothetical protein